MTIDLDISLVDPSVSAQINVARSNMKVAPEGMVFTLELSGFDTPGPATPTGYNPQHHEIYYFWDFGDAGSAFDATVNAQPHQRDANCMTGPVAAHTYAKAGSYTVRVLVVEPASGKATIAKLNLSGSNRVLDPNEVFGGQNTYWMDLAGNSNGAPNGALVYSDIQAALDHAWQNQKPCRLLFRDGQTWDLSGILDVRGERAYVNVMMVGEGGANPAVLRVNGNNDLIRFRNWYADNQLDVVFAGLEFQGPWDETTELNPDVSPTGISLATSSAAPHAPDYFWAHNCKFNGFYSAINQGVGAAGSAFGVSNCIIESWLNIGMYLNHVRPTAVIGTRMARDPLALAGGRKPAHNVHGPIRSQVSGPMVIAKCDMFTNAGWFQNVFGWRTQQPCLRLFQSGLEGGLANIAQNTLEGGYQIVALSRQDRQFGLGSQNAIVDGNLLVGGHQTAFAISAEFGGITVRNNVFIRPNVPSINAIYDPLALIRATLPEGTEIGPATQQQLDTNAQTPLQIYSNTYAMLMEDGSFAGQPRPPQFVVAPGFSHVSEANNIAHAPFSTTPIVLDAPLDTTALFLPRMQEGYRSAYEQITLTTTAVVPDGGTLTVPYAAGRGMSDYGPTTDLDPHEIGVPGGRFNSHSGGGATFVFGSANFTVTNTSGQPWNAGSVKIVLYALNNPAPVDTTFGTPIDTIASFAPLAGSSALGDAGPGPVAMTDFYGNRRPAYPSRGAFEIAD